jgi:MFS superfamily sulfate permease-like transporter
VKGLSIQVADVIAGVSMAGLLLPEAVAYSGIASLPPQAGVIGLFAGLVGYGLIGRSRFAIVSATSSSAAVVGAATLSIAGPDAAPRAALAAAFVVATGIAFMLACAARLGAISNFISKPVLRGFSFGLALAIVIKQLPKMTGVHPQAAFLPAFFEQLVAALPQWNWTSVALGVAALVLLKAISRVRRTPGALIVIAAGIAAGEWLRGTGHGVDVVGPFALSLAAPTLPDLTRSQWLSVGELALALLLLLFAESYSAIRSMALKHGDDVSPDRDLLALGVANLLSGLFRGMPVGAGYSATSANEASGAQSRASAWIAAVAVALLLAAFLPLIERTPEPVLAAIVIHAVSHTLTLDAFSPYFRWRRDRLVVVASALAVLLLGVLDGLLAGIAISLAMTLRGFSQPRVSELGRVGTGHDFLILGAHPNVSRIPGVIVLRPEAPLFFANVERMLSDMRARIAQAAPRSAVISLEETPDLDGTSVEALIALVAEQSQHGVTLVFARLKDPVLALLQSAMCGEGQALLQPGSVDDAVASLIHEGTSASTVS